MPLELYHSRAARNDLKEIWDYGERAWGEARVEAYLDGIQTQLRLLCTHPEAGKERSEFGIGIRTFPVAEHILIYRALDNKLEVIRIAHARSDYAELLL